MFSWLNFKGNYSWYIYLIPLIAAISLSFYLPDKSKRFIFSIRGILTNLGFLLLFAPLVVMPLHKYEQNIVVNVGETDTELVQAWLDSCDDKFGEDASLNKIKESWAHGFIHPKMEYKPDNLVNKHKGIDDYKPITLKSGKVVALDSFITSPKKNFFRTASMGEWTGGKNHYLLCTRNEKVRQQIDEEYEKELEKDRDTCEYTTSKVTDPRDMGKRKWMQRTNKMITGMDCSYKNSSRFFSDIINGYWKSTDSN